MERAQRNKNLHLLPKGVERDGWRFVLLAPFSPILSYAIDYALAATDVGVHSGFPSPDDHWQFANYLTEQIHRQPCWYVLPLLQHLRVRSPRSDLLYFHCFNILISM